MKKERVFLCAGWQPKLLLLLLFVVGGVAGCFPEIEPVTRRAITPSFINSRETTAAIALTQESTEPVAPENDAAVEGQAPPLTPTPTVSPLPLPSATGTAVETPTTAAQDFEAAIQAYRGVSFNYGESLADNAVASLIPAEPYLVIDGAIIPQHGQVDFEGYALDQTFYRPRIYVYPLEAFRAGNQVAAERIARLEQLLIDRPAEPEGSIPALPLFSAGEMWRSQLRYLDFQNGRGVRYLTQFGQSYKLINNRELFYSFQGITDDGDYYVAAILPTNHPLLPSNENFPSVADAQAFVDNYDGYAAGTTRLLEEQEDSSFVPGLAQLDALIRSIEVLAGSGPGNRASEYNYSGWQSYENPDHEYSLFIPPNVTVTEAADGSKVSFDGPRLDGEPWPSFSISHFSSDFYRPPAGSKVSPWVLGRGIPHDAIGQTTEIAGLPAIHLIVEPTPQSYGFDEFYFINDEQLFRILILHTAGNQDWSLYDQFLQGITIAQETAEEGGAVEAWLGTIGRLPPGSQSQYTFDRQDGQSFFITDVNKALELTLEEAAWRGVQIKIWGDLAEAPGFIEVSRLEQDSQAESVIQNLSSFASASASSELPADRLGNYQAQAAIDGRLESPWCEGAARTGTGQWLLLELPGPVQLSQVRLANGYEYNDDIYQDNNRLKMARLLFSNGEVSWELEDERGYQSLNLEQLLGRENETIFVRIQIEDTYPGSKYDDSCIAEIEIWGRSK